MSAVQQMLVASKVQTYPEKVFLSPFPRFVNQSISSVSPYDFNAVANITVNQSISSVSPYDFNAVANITVNLTIGA